MPGKEPSTIVERGEAQMVAAPKRAYFPMAGPSFVPQSFAIQRDNLYDMNSLNYLEESFQASKSLTQ